MLSLLLDSDSFPSRPMRENPPHVTRTPVLPASRGPLRAAVQLELPFWSSTRPTRPASATAAEKPRHDKPVSDPV